MKKTLVLLSALLIGASAFAQNRSIRERELDTVKEAIDFRTDWYANPTAGTTQTQAGATEVTAYMNYVTVGNTNDGVKVAALSSYSNGQSVVVYNPHATNNLKVYPATGEDIGAGTNTAVDLAAGYFLVAQKLNGAWVSTQEVGYLEVTDGTNTVNLDLSGDRIFHDTDADGTKDDGENWIDGGGAIFVEKHASSHTLSAAECYGAVYYVTAASVVLTLPAAADGMSLTVISNTANAVTVDANASDLIILDGTALDDGDSIDSAGAAGDIATLTYYDATGWFASTNTWVDGGP